MRVTLGEVNRNVLRLEAAFNGWTQSHERGHETNARWLVTTGLSLVAAIVAIWAAVGTR